VLRSWLLSQSGSQLAGVGGSQNKVLPQPCQVRSALRHARGCVRRIERAQNGEDRLPPFLARFGFAEDLVKSRARLTAALPIQHEIGEDPGEGIAIADTLTGFSEFENAPRDD